jgi:hypothetical protein
MLVLRQEQIEALELAAAEPFIAQLGGFVREQRADAVAALTAEVLRARVVWGVTIARRYSFDSEAAIALFVLALFTLGPAFHRHPAIRAILDERDTPDEMRMDRVANDLPPDTIGEVLTFGNGGEWLVPLEQAVP